MLVPMPDSMDVESDMRSELWLGCRCMVFRYSAFQRTASRGFDHAEVKGVVNPLLTSNGDLR